MRAVDPADLIRAAIQRGALQQLPSFQPVRFVAAGKAAWPMAQAFCDAVPGVSAGLVSGTSARPGHQLDSVRTPAVVEYFAGGHPFPNRASELAARRAVALATLPSDEGALVVLLSGGASSMLAAPAEGITIAEKIAAVRALMDVGTPIDELNCVRKHLSAIKGGRLAACAHRTITLALSDVSSPVEDDPAVIGSGPTVGDPTTFADALDAVRRSGAVMPAAVVRRLTAGAAGRIAETPKPGDPALERSTIAVIGGRRLAMAGARDCAVASGYSVLVIDRPTRGDAREAARQFVQSAVSAAAGRKEPMCVIASGETTVRIAGDGRGGRNQEFALAAAPLLAAFGRAVLASAGTDGIDGPTDAAGAVADPTTLARALSLGLNWETSLARNDSYGFFQPLGDLITWGPTGTNVGDIHVMLVGGERGSGDASASPATNLS